LSGELPERFEKLRRRRRKSGQRKSWGSNGVLARQRRQEGQGINSLPGWADWGLVGGLAKTGCANSEREGKKPPRTGSKKPWKHE